MKGKISYIDQNIFLHQAVNVFFSAVNLGILTWGVYGIDSLLQPASSGQSMNCSFSHFLVGFTRESGRLPLGMDASIRYSGLVSAPIRSFSADRLSVRRDRSKSDVVHILFCVVVKPHENHIKIIKFSCTIFQVF